MGGSVKVFKTTSALWNNPAIAPVVEQFKKYKNQMHVPTTFGRDAPLVRPSEAKYAGLQHIHLGVFNPINYQYSRTSDSWLIYATGFMNQNHFLLIDILSPDAHNKANSIDLMNKYINLASKFRETH
ncbi:type II toxin-antitoxin system YafO family toxin [Shewanella algae]|uniref:type II toxin-antitoxin system YafO family toxin n=1 Tax=Shewanella algae TaxID=38313 RepID=UPI0031F512BC